jgi:hypothetical protein
MNSGVDMLNFLADFGEMGALAPAMAAVAIFLLFTRASRLALAWSLAMLLAVGATYAIKAESGPVSGHAAVSSAFYGGLAVLLWRTSPSSSWPLRGLSIALVFLAGLVTWCVWMLGWHSIEDVASGLLVGCVSLAAFSCTGRSHLLRQKAALTLLFIVIASLAPLHGLRFKYASSTDSITADMGRCSAVLQRL